MAALRFSMPSFTLPNTLHLIDDGGLFTISCIFVIIGDAKFLFILFYFISFIGHRNSRLQGERPMGLVQTGKRDPCKAQTLNTSMTR
jgi:hypothetical protein